MLWFYSVQGTGAFPTDMLRYDRAWPATSADVSRIHASSRDEAWVERSIVAVIGLDEPTEARWASFGWSVL